MSTLRLLSSLVGLQLFSRLFTFLLNQSLLHFASPEAFGTASIQFELFLNTILFLSREGVRNALLRSKTLDASCAGKKEDFERTLRVAYIPLILGLPLALVACFGYHWIASAEAKAQSYFTLALSIYTIAAVVELASEPMHNLALAESRTNLRVKAEGFAVGARTTVTFLVLLCENLSRKSGETALLAFSVGQLSYSFLLVAIYTSYYGFSRLVPKLSQFESFLLDRNILQLAKSMTSQSLIKHVLTEGDKFLLSWLAPLQDQGGYAVAVNYGSLVARIILQPLEETSRIFFSKAAARLIGKRQQQVINPGTDTNTTISISDYFTNLLRILSTFSLLILTFAPHYLPLILPFILPKRYICCTSAPQILEIWIYYIPVLAFNGVLEAFHSAVADPTALARQSWFMTLFSVVYISSAVVFFTVCDLGDVSLVYANMVNLVARIGYCGLFAKRWFESSESAVIIWKSIAPRWSMLLIMTISKAVIVADGARLKITGDMMGLRAMFEHLVVGTGLGLCCLGVWWMTEGKSVMKGTRGKTD